MSRLPEQRLWDRLRRNVAPYVDKIERIENSAAVGTPDTLILHRGRVTFAEHKVALTPMRETTRLQWKHKLTPEQRNWHIDWTNKKGNSFIVVGIDLNVFAVPGKLVDEITNMTYKQIAPYRVSYADLINLYRTGRI